MTNKTSNKAIKAVDTFQMTIAPMIQDGEHTVLEGWYKWGRIIVDDGIVVSHVISPFKGYHGNTLTPEAFGKISSACKAIAVKFDTWEAFDQAHTEYNMAQIEDGKKQITAIRTVADKLAPTGKKRKPRKPVEAPEAPEAPVTDTGNGFTAEQLAASAATLDDGALFKLARLVVDMAKARSEANAA